MAIEKATREQILHDLKRIAVAINQLVRDLDKIERESLNDNPDTDNISIHVS